jgi:uncharacterized BrkB/YihY/UPF0761 family membrane protein
MRPIQPPRTWDFLLTGFLVFIELLLVVIFLISAVTFAAISQECAAEAVQCSATRVQFGQQICTFAPPLIALITIPWAITRVLRRKLAFWLALAGVALMTLAFLGGRLLLDSGIPGA